MTRLTLLFCAAAFAWPITVRAQDRSPVDTHESDPPAHIAFVEGTAVLERDGRNDTSPSTMPLLEGDRVRTQGGRVEILFGDGSTLHLDANTTVDFLSDELVRLLVGRIRLTIPGPNRSVSYRVDAPSGWAQFSQPGEYRLAVLAGDRDTETELAVVRGAAELANESGRTVLRAGERAFSRADAAPSLAYVFNSASWDGFDRWSEVRHDQRRGLSTQYLPEQVRPYAASFDQYGAWRQDPSYGYVWYPRVSVGWRPYYYGRWETLRPYGWTWIGSDAWAWPTHHYGRWGVSAGAWFWIPGRSWSPAWVSWAYAPGYVSWCPLGWNNRPVVQIVNVNIYNRGYDPWRAWTAVPQRHFGERYVNVRVASAGVIDSRTRGAFVPGTRAPSHGGFAVPRSSAYGAPIRVAGTAVLRRGTSPVYSNLEAGNARVTGPSRTIVPRENLQGSSPDRAVQSSRERPDRAPRGYPRATVPPDVTAPDSSPDRSRRSPAATTYGGLDDPRVGRRNDERYQPIDPARRGVPREDRSSETAAVPSSRSSQPSIDRQSRPPYGVGPRSERGGGYQPPQQDRRGPAEPRQADVYRAPGPDRAMPRAPRENAPAPAPAPAQRQSPGTERRAPGPGGPAASPPAGSSRSRPGGQPSGTAVRRPGGGR